MRPVNCTATGEDKTATNSTARRGWGRVSGCSQQKRILRFVEGSSELDSVFSDKRQCSGSLLWNLRVTTQITIMGPRLSRCGRTPNSYLHKYRAHCVRIMLTEIIINFDVLLTLHLSIILVINQLNAQKSSLNMCTGRPPTGVMIPDAV